MKHPAINTVLVGDCIDQMQRLPAGVFHCVVTSPPYFALRSYLPKDRPDKAKEIGSEPTIEAFVATMASVFREVRRVLRDDGVCWVNLGDTFATTELAEGNQLLIPHRVALALQADGWCIRQTMIWKKDAPMPESLSGWRWRRCRVKISPQVKGKQNGAIHQARSRDMSNGEYLGSAVWSPCPGCPKCLPNGGYVLRRGKWRTTTSFEYVFMLTKGGDYFCDGDAVQEGGLNTCTGRTRGGKGGGLDRDGQVRANGSFKAEQLTETRNPRSVLTFPGEPFRGAHFATFPSSMPAFFIKSSTSKAGCCAECGACFAPMVESERVPTRPGLDNQIDASGMANRDPQRHVARTTVTGYKPTCSCGAASEPCRVFDPFLGSGSTARAAEWLGRDWCGIDLNTDYAEMARKRIKRPPKWARPANAKPEITPDPAQKTLFDLPANSAAERALIGGGA